MECFEKLDTTSGGLTHVSNKLRVVLILFDMWDPSSRRALHFNPRSSPVETIARRPDHQYKLPITAYSVTRRRCEWEMLSIKRMDPVALRECPRGWGAFSDRLMYLGHLYTRVARLWHHHLPGYLPRYQLTPATPVNFIITELAEHEARPSEVRQDIKRYNQSPWNHYSSVSRRSGLRRSLTLAIEQWDRSVPQRPSCGNGSTVQAQTCCDITMPSLFPFHDHFICIYEL
jgi:hypothetical protein